MAVTGLGLQSGVASPASSSGPTFLGDLCPFGKAMGLRLPSGPSLLKVAKIQSLARTQGGGVGRRPWG